MKSTEKKIKTQINKQTWPESWKEMKGKVGACHGITQKSARGQKNDFSGMEISACTDIFSGDSWDGQACQEEIGLTQDLKQS